MTLVNMVTVSSSWNTNRELKQGRRRRQRERQKKKKVSIGKTTTLHVHQSFLYISLPSLYDYDVKMSNFTFNGGREHNDFLFLS